VGGGRQNVPAIQQKKFNWLPRQSMYQEMQTWRARRQLAAENFTNNFTAINSKLAEINDSNMSGIVELTVRKAVNRVNAQAQAKLASSLNVTA
jgi:hypothetical protein